MKSRADFEEACSPSIDDKTPLGRNSNAAQQLKKRTLARTVGSDNSNNFASLDFKGYASQGPYIYLLQLCLLARLEPPDRGAHRAFEGMPHAVRTGLPLADGIPFADILDGNGRFRHSSRWAFTWCVVQITSAKVRSVDLK